MILEMMLILLLTMAATLIPLLGVHAGSGGY